MNECVLFSRHQRPILFPQLAQLYPSIAFVSFAGFITGPPNYANLFVRNYEPAYLADHASAIPSLPSLPQHVSFIVQKFENHKAAFFI